MDGEVAIQQENNDKPFVYRGFQMVGENKLRELRGDVPAQADAERYSGADLRASLLAAADARNLRQEQVKAGKMPAVMELPTV